MKTIAIALLLALSGCASVPEDGSRIDYSHRPSDWPELRIEVHVVNVATLRQKCNPAEAETIYACAVPNFCERRCDTYYLGAAYQRDIIEHENAHCRGFDHPGGTTMRDSWDYWKRRPCR